jgi:signal transduction histidine kinase
LQQIKEQWEQSFDAVQDPMAVLAPDYRIVRANRAYAAHLGREIVQVPGKYCYELRSLSKNRYPLTDQGLCENCPAATTREDQAAASTNITDREERRWVVSAYPVRTEIAGTVICHYRDVTSEVQRLGQIAIADKLASVGKLAGAVAHELNSPMTSIMVFSEALAQKAEDESIFYQHAVEINEAARRCRRLIQGLLHFARRPQSQQRTTVRVAEVWAEMQPLVRHRIDILGAVLEVDLPPDLPAVPVIVADLEHVLVALVTNATEACGKGDRIRLTAEVLSRDRFLQISVSDTGRGMSSEELASAMDPFFTTKPATQASGLGLTTVEAVLSEMGGTIRLESEEGQGTSAYVCLPLPEEGT